MLQYIFYNQEEWKHKELFDHAFIGLMELLKIYDNKKYTSIINNAIKKESKTEDNL